MTDLLTTPRDPKADDKLLIKAFAQALEDDRAASAVRHCHLIVLVDAAATSF